MHYFAHHIGDFMRDTAHLELEEEAVYRRLIDRYYLDEKPFEDNLGKICRSIRARGSEDLVQAMLEEFFTQDNGVWRHSRIDAEVEKYREKSEKARKSANARWNKSGSNANAERTHSGGNANHKPITNNQKPINQGESSLSENSSGTLIDINWNPPLTCLQQIADNVGVDAFFVLDCVPGFSAHFSGKTVNDPIAELQKWVTRENQFKNK